MAAPHDAKKLAEQFYSELASANSGGPDALYAIMNKWYSPDIEQYEAGEQVSRVVFSFIDHSSANQRT